MRGFTLIFILFICSQFDLSGQALFELPDSLKLRDTLMVKSWDDQGYSTFADSTDAFEAHQYRITRLRSFSDISLGNNGTESMATVFNIDPASGFRSGYNGYQAYRWTTDDLRFYDANIAYSTVGASLGNSFANSSTSSQENAQATAFFTRNFANRVNVSLDYRNINEKGIYSRDQSKHTQVKFQINQFSKSNQLFWYVSWIRNAFNRQENNGSDSLHLLTDSLYILRENIPIRFDDGGSRDASNDFSIGWKWSTNKNTDKGFLIENRTSYLTRSFKFYLSETSQIDSFYTPFTFPTDTMDLRNAFDYNSTSNDFAISWRSKFFQSIKVGYNYSYVAYHQIPQDERWHYGSLYGDLQLNIGPTIDFNVHAYIETLEEAGDFELKGTLDLNWEGIGTLTGLSSFGRQTPSFNRRRLIFNQETFYNYNQDAYNYFTLGGNLQIPKLGLTVGVKQSIIDNYTYFNPQFETVTSNDIITITELRATAQWRLFKKWYLKNQFQYHIMDDEVFALPNWQSRHTLFYQGKIKKNGMIFRLGVEGEVRQMTFRPRYVPFIQQYIPSQEVIDIQGIIHRIDPYVQFDISTFSIFLKGENIQSLWWGKPYVQVTDRPVFDWMFRIGVNWKLLN